jgi:hypothetical protein
VTSPGSPLLLQSVRGNAIDALNCDQFALDDIHDPIPADSKPEHVPHRKDSAGYGFWARASNAATTAVIPVASSRNREAVVTPLGTTRLSTVLAEQEPAGLLVRDGSRSAGRGPFPVFLQGCRGLGAFEFIRRG